MTGKIPIGLQGEGTYDYKCHFTDCFYCELMNRGKDIKPKEYAVRNYQWGVIPIKKYTKKYTKKSA